MAILAICSSRNNNLETSAPININLATHKVVITVALVVMSIAEEVSLFRSLLPVLDTNIIYRVTERYFVSLYYNGI